MTEKRQRNPLLDRLGRLLEAALARALALDAPTREQLAALEGRRIGIDLRGTGLALALTVRDGRLAVGPHWERAGDLDLRASPGSLLAFALGRSPSAAKAMDGRERPLRSGAGSALPPGKVEVSGDAELARRFEALLRRYRPDVEEAFARTFGDVIGVPLAQALLSAWTWSRESAQALVRDGAEFLRDETRDVAAPAEVEQFVDAVDALRERADRLGARVDRLAPRGRAR